MAGGILSSVLRLADKLSSSVRRSLAGAASSSSSSSFDAPHVVEDDLKKLKCTLDTIESVLRDAERREVREESVKLWLRELKGVAYDADDVLDEFEYELLRSHRSFKHPRSTPGQKRKHDEARELTIPPSPLDDASFRRRVVLRIKEINRRLDAIARDCARLRLTEADGPRRAEKAARASTSSHAQPSEIYGREDERKKLVDLLLSADYGRSNNVSVVSIVGMAGVGKSTLAQLACSDQTVSQHFDTKGWVQVHENFDTKRLMQEIIDSVTKSPRDLNEIGVLEEHLSERLKGKRFLLVLDDVWNEEQVLWERLRLALSSGAEGSRVLVTTRIEPVARIMQSAAVIELSCLSENDCRSLFERWAFDCRDPKASPGLVEIGRNIALKCRGLPLAARVMGGLLRFEADEEGWIDLLRSDVWDLGETGSAILPALKLSYQRLPAHLKRCFVHCVAFPKGFVFKKDPLVRQWMVQGFVQAAADDDGKAAPEDVASECFDELVSRSFFQHSLLEFGEDEKFLMHDLLHDLARYISGEECVVTENSDLRDLSAETRHLSLTPCGSKVNMEFKSAAKEVPLRSLQLIYTLPYFYGGAAMLDFNLVRIKLPPDFFSKFLRLRTLDLAYTAIEELPESVSNLKHLRYLSLRNSKIRKLPESVCKLWYLQTLDLEYCSDLCELPSGIGKLSDLRHLLLPSLDQSFVCIPSGIMSLTNLQQLSAINVGGDGAHCSIGALKNMKDLRGDLYVSGLRNVAHGGDAKQANLESKSHIQRLTLDWHAHQSDRKCSHSKLSSDRGYYDTKAITAPWEFFEDESLVLENLRPNADVVVLHIRNYGGKRFPSWLGDPSFSSLQTLQLYMCEKCENLPPLGDLPCLKNLYARGLPSVRRIGPETCGVKKFAALEKLEFEWMPEWEEWIGAEESTFSRLDELALLGCPKLKHFPVSIALSLKKLTLRDCHQLAAFPAPHSLTSLSIAGACQETIWSCILNLPLLEEMEVVCCEGLTALPLFNMPVLKTLVIEGCSQLASIDSRGCALNVCDVASSSTSSAGTLVGLHNLVSLEVLKIEDCPVMQFAEDERLPPKLKELDISCCPALMEWCLGPKGSAQLAAVQEVIVADLDQDLVNELVMDTMNEESDTMNEESEDDMEED